MRGHRVTSIRILLAAATGVGVLTLAACEGSNLFTTATGVGTTVVTADTVAPSVDILNIPHGTTSTTVPLGDSVLIRAQLQDNVGVASVRMYGIAKRGADSLGTGQAVPRYVEKDITFPAGLQDTTVVRYLDPTADSTQETVYFIVEATDSSGNVGADTVSMQAGGPSVAVLDLQSGDTITPSFSFRVMAKDPLGIADITWEVRDSATAGAAFDSTATRTFANVDSAVAQEDMTLPSTFTGTIEVLSTAKNSVGVVGRAAPVYVTIVAGQVSDTIAPRLKYTTTAGDRLELTDSIQVDVTGSDNVQGSGVAKVGYTVRAISVNRGDTITRTADTTYATPKSGTVRASFRFAPFNVDSVSLPDPLKFEITTYMVDAAGNCGASVGADTLAALPCQTLTGGGVVAQDATPTSLDVTVVAGNTVTLPNGGLIMDAVVDRDANNTHGGPALYLSNIQDNEVDVFYLKSDSFGRAIGVGSEPWGLTINNCVPLNPTPGCGDTLVVANSGGTNLSNVSLITKQEDTSRRLLTPDVHLFDVTVSQDAAGNDKYTVTAYPDLPDQFSFSDRPEFVARDSTGRLLYSTKTVTSLGEVGTIRTVESKPGYLQPEVRLLLQYAQGNKSASSWRFGNVDAIGNGTDSLTVVDHVPGNPTNLIAETGIDPDAPDNAYALLKAAGSDVFMVPGETWNIKNVGFSDTTFVSASGDGGWVAFGDGNVSPVGRVIMWNAQNRVISGSISVADLMTNTGDQIEGLGLNYDGTMGVVRGISQVSFFTTDLRLQGTATLSVPGGAGAVFDPFYADAQTLSNSSGVYDPNTDLAFIGTGQHTIDIYDTFRFRRIGRVFVKDNIVGPLRAAPPLPSDKLDAAGNPLQCTYTSVRDQAGNVISPANDALQIYQGGDFNTPLPPTSTVSEDRCVVVKLYGVTDSGGVVVVNVRKSDVLRDHPARQ